MTHLMTILLPVFFHQPCWLLQIKNQWIPPWLPISKDCDSPAHITICNPPFLITHAPEPPFLQYVEYKQSTGRSKLFQNTFDWEKYTLYSCACDHMSQGHPYFQQGWNFCLPHNGGSPLHHQSQVDDKIQQESIFKALQEKGSTEEVLYEQQRIFIAWKVSSTTPAVTTKWCKLIQQQIKTYIVLELYHIFLATSITSYYWHSMNHCKSWLNLPTHNLNTVFNWLSWVNQEGEMQKFSHRMNQSLW